MIRQHIREALLVTLNSASTRENAFSFAYSVAQNPDLSDGDVRQIIDEEIEAIQKWFDSQK